MKVLKVLLIVAGIVVLIVAALVLTAGRRVARYEAIGAADLAAVRARAAAAAARPPLRGEARAGVDAMPEYLKAMEGVAAVQRAGPRFVTGTALLPKVRAEIAAVRAATQAERCDWSPRTADIADQTPWVSASHLAAALVLEGGERAAADDLRGAAERHLDAMRFGTDIGRCGGVLSTAIAYAILNDAAKSLAPVIERADAALREQIARELAVIEAEVPPLADTFRVERAAILPLLTKLARGGSAEELSMTLPLPLMYAPRLFGPPMLPGVVRTFDDLEAACRLPTHAERVRRLDEIEERAHAGYNLFVQLIAHNGRMLEHEHDARERIAALAARAAR